MDFTPEQTPKETEKTEVEEKTEAEEKTEMPKRSKESWRSQSYRHYIMTGGHPKFWGTLTDEQKKEELS